LKVGELVEGDAGVQTAEVKLEKVVGLVVGGEGDGGGGARREGAAGVGETLLWGGFGECG